MPSSTDNCGESNVKVVCLGLSRTGTTSLSIALDILGFGPCFHTFRLKADDDATEKLDLPLWIESSKAGNAVTRAAVHEAFRGFRSVLDEPPALFPEILYNAYPEAKFILTVRDTAKWERSTQKTLLPIMRLNIASKAPKTELEAQWKEWSKCKENLQPEIFSDTKSVILRHNALVKSIIPPEKLLVFDVSDGWDRLVDFLGVPKPSVAFPNVNDTETFIKVVIRPLLA